MERTTCYAYEEITVAAAAVGLTPALITQGGQQRIEARIIVSGAAVCFRYDGSNPTANTVNFLNPGDTIRLDTIDKMQKFKAISQSGSAAKLGVNYEKVTYGN